MSTCQVVYLEDDEAQDNVLAEEHEARTLQLLPEMEGFLVSPLGLPSGVISSMACWKIHYEYR